MSERGEDGGGGSVRVVVVMKSVPIQRRSTHIRTITQTETPVGLADKPTYQRSAAAVGADWTDNSHMLLSLFCAWNSY